MDSDRPVPGLEVAEQSGSMLEIWECDEQAAVFRKNYLEYLVTLDSALDGDDDSARPKRGDVTRLMSWQPTHKSAPIEFIANVSQHHTQSGARFAPVGNSSP